MTARLNSVLQTLRLLGEAEIRGSPVPAACGPLVQRLNPGPISQRKPGAKSVTQAGGPPALDVFRGNKWGLSGEGAAGWPTTVCAGVKG